MKVRPKARALTVAVVAATAGVIVFAVLQYRWSTEVIDATGVRMADTLQLSMVNWQLDFERNFSEITTTLRPDRGAGTGTPLALLSDRFAEWREVARYPKLVSDIWVVSAAAAGDTLRLDPAVRSFERTVPPSEIARIPETVASVPSVWIFDPDGPALVHPLPRESGFAIQDSAVWLVVSLNDSVIGGQILPDLAHRYFQGTDGLDYEVAVAAGMPPRRVIYTSDPGFGDREVADADGTMNIFGRSAGRGSPAPLSVFHRTSERYEPVASAAITWFPLRENATEAGDWRLVVRHRRGGPLGAFVANMHRRSLVISFGALLLLLISIGMLFVTSSRAQRLAKLQMDFVTAVSHELRTPLTVISSAADNIAQGVVQGREQLRQYGSVIGTQAGQLAALVEEILMFAATNTRPQRLTLMPLAVRDIVATTLASMEELIRAAQFTVEHDIPEDLPPVMGDLVALSQLLRNLITNALKYGRDGRWLGISARVVERGPGAREVHISVADRGPGINPADLPRIFEPFYRSPSVTSAQIRGTGLGLTLAKGLAEAMKGELTVASLPGGGTTFTLDLPAVEMQDRELRSVDAPTAAA